MSVDEPLSLNLFVGDAAPQRSRQSGRSQKHRRIKKLGAAEVGADEPRKSTPVIGDEKRIGVRAATIEGATEGGGDRRPSLANTSRAAAEDSDEEGPSRAPTSLHNADAAVTFTDALDVCGHGAPARQPHSNARKRPRASAEDAEDERLVDEAIELAASDMSDVLAAVQAAQRRETALAHDEDVAAPQGADDSAHAPVAPLKSLGVHAEALAGQPSAKASKHSRGQDVKSSVPRQASKAGLSAGHGVAAAPAFPDSLEHSNAKTFQELGLSNALSAHLEASGFKAPTNVQKHSVPAILKGRDVMMRAPTGTGKTVAYLAPVVNMLSAANPRISRAEGCHALIITPTRELTLQVHTVANVLTKRFIWLVPGLLIGGENRHHEKQRLRKGVVILVATPGRALDHLKSTVSFVTSNLQYLVLDEADRLLDMGFQGTISEIVDQLRTRSNDPEAKWQTVLVSATLHMKLGNMAEELLDSPALVGLTARRVAGGKLALSEDADDASAFQLPVSLQQLYVDVPVKLRLPTLLGTVKLCFMRTANCKMVIFVTTCDGVEFLYDVFTTAYAQATKEDVLVDGAILKLHGDMSPGDRTDNMTSFHKCAKGILISTDVAARGLDFPAVTHILQYDSPGEVAEYVQRVGRTARMGKRGVAVLFLAPGEIEYVDSLKAAGVQITQQKLFPSLNALPKPPNVSKRAAAETERNRRVFQVAMDAAHMCQAQLINVIESNQQLRSKAGDAFRSFVGAYTTHPEHLRGIFHIKKLHLGHVAHSFALKDQPKRLGQSASKKARKEAKKSSQRAQISGTRRQYHRSAGVQGKEYRVAGGLV